MEQQLYTLIWHGYQFLSRGDRQIYHHMKLGKPVLNRPIDTPLASKADLYENNVYDYDHHSWSFEKLEDAVTAAEKVIGVTREPHIPLFDPDNDKWEIEVAKMYIVDGRVFLGESVVTVDYAWGTYQTYLGPHKDENRHRRGRVENKWKVINAALETESLYNTLGMRPDSAIN